MHARNCVPIVSKKSPASNWTTDWRAMRKIVFPLHQKKTMPAIEAQTEERRTKLCSHCIKKKACRRLSHRPKGRAQNCVPIVSEKNLAGDWGTNRRATAKLCSHYIRKKWLRHRLKNCAQNCVSIASKKKGLRRLR